jgi:hypothetical protein
MSGRPSSVSAGQLLKFGVIFSVEMTSLWPK